MSHNYSDVITEISNNLFLVIAAYGYFRAMVWRRNGRLSGETRDIVLGWEIIFISVGVRIGYWSIALASAPIDATYHPAMVEWKWFITLPTALGFAWGMLRIISVIDQRNARHKYLVIGCAFLLSLLPTLLHADGDCRRYSEHPNTCITHQHQPPNGRISTWENMLTTA